MKMVLGLDCGGTKTVCAVASIEGELLGFGWGGPSNILAVGKETAVKSLAEAVGRAISQASHTQGRRFEAVWAGAAGVGSKRTERAISRILRGLVKARSISVSNDSAIALAGAIPNGPGTIVVAGTGSIAYGKDRNGRFTRAGGWGYVLGDEGSAFDMGRKAISASLRAFDGRGKSTVLLNQIRRRFGISRRFGTSDLHQLIEKVHEGSIDREEIASLAPMVCEASQSDEIALNIISGAANELALTASSVIRSLEPLEESPVVSTAGSVFSCGAVSRMFEDKLRLLHPGVRIVQPAFPPVVGAILLALEKIGKTVSEETLGHIRASLCKPEFARVQRLFGERNRPRRSR